MAVTNTYLKMARETITKQMFCLALILETEMQEQWMSLDSEEKFEAIQYYLTAFRASGYNESDHLLQEEAMHQWVIAIKIDNTEIQICK